MLHEGMGKPANSAPKGSAMALVIRCTYSHTALRDATSVSSTVKSSPPMRATVSVSGTQACSHAAYRFA